MEGALPASEGGKLDVDFLRDVGTIGVESFQLGDEIDGLVSIDRDPIRLGAPAVNSG